MKRRLLALFLAVTMLVGMIPSQTFAAEWDSTEIVTEEPVADPVVQTSEPEATEEESVPEETTLPAETQEETTLPEESTEETTEETTLPEETTEETTLPEEPEEETTQPQEDLETLETDPAADAVVYVTGANAGVLVKASDGKPIFNRPVTVKDLDSDGVLTYDEALVAAHAAFCPDGYATKVTNYGITVSKLWGVEDDVNYYFFNNQVALTVNVGESVKAGDKLYATVLKDTTNYTDFLSFFNAEEKTVEAGESFTLTLKGFQGMTSSLDSAVVIPGASVGTWNNGTFTPISGKTTDAEGSVTLSFDTPGTYYVTAEGTIAATSYQGVSVQAPTMPACCVVTVTTKAQPDQPEQSAPHYLASLGFGPNSAKNIPLEENVWKYTITDAANNKYFYYFKAVLSEDAPEESKITLNWTSFLGTEQTRTPKSGSQTSLGAFVNTGIEGNTLTITVGVEGDTQTYIVDVERTPVLYSGAVTDGSENDLINIDGAYYLPESESVVLVTFNSYGAPLTVNGKQAVGGEPVSLAPLWDEKNEFTVTGVVDYNGTHLEKTVIIRNWTADTAFTGKCGTDVTWKLQGDVLTISGTGAMDNFNDRWTRPEWDDFKDFIHTVKVESGVTTLGDYAFYEYTELKTVELADTVTNTGKRTFRYCASLKNLNLGKGLETIGEYAFGECTTLAEVNLPETVTTIDSDAFYGCTELTRIHLHEGITEIGSGAFRKSGMTSIELPSSVTKMGNQVLSYCNNLTSVTINGLMGSAMFLSCPKLENVTFKGNALKTIPARAFTSCSSLRSLEIPEGVVTVEDQIYSQTEFDVYSAYYTRISISSTVEKIVAGAFGDNVTEIVLSPENTHLKLVDGVLYTADGKTLIGASKGVSGHVTVLDGVETIGSNAFRSCIGITGITLPDTVKTIEKWAFRECSGMQTIAVGKGLETIGEEAFLRCSALTALELPESLTSIGKTAFRYCSSLKTIEIPGQVTSLPEMLFAACTSLESIVVPTSVTSMTSNTFANCESLKTIYYRGTSTQWNAIKSRPTSSKYELVYNYGRTDIAYVTVQPEDRMFILGNDARDGLSVTIAVPENVTASITWYTNTTRGTTGGTLFEGEVTTSEDGLTSAITPDISAVGMKYYYCVVTSTLADGTQLDSISRVATVEVSKKMWEGEGTSSNPFLLATQEDVQKLSEYVSAGNSTSGKYFAVTETIELPKDWVPIGTGYRFAGTIDGDFDGDGECATIRVPAGEKPLLSMVQNATIKNLNVYGEKINGFGLINDFVGISVVSETVVDNITILSGTQIKKSGILGSYITSNIYAGCSATYYATIRNCTIQPNVIIGYEGNQAQIGSIAGQFQGSVENCVSYATVKGDKYVGGLVGCRDNAMGGCKVINSQFHGTVQGNSYVGGIMGSGYTGPSAENGVKPTITGCFCDGTVIGQSAVGGILGGDPGVYQAWNSYSITDNKFTGTISGTEYVGAIIGFYRSLNKLENIANNRYSDTCGAASGIGFIQYIDTSCENPYLPDGASQIDTSKGTENCPMPSSWTSWKLAMNRTDDPLGADADKLCRKLTIKTPQLEVMVNRSYMADKQNPQKAVLGENNILRIENRSASFSYLWFSVEEGSTIDYTLYHGYRNENYGTYLNKCTNNNVYDGTTYQYYINNYSNFTTPYVAKFVVTDTNENVATYYLVVDAGEAGSYAIGGNGFTSESELYTPGKGIAFTQAGQTLTLVPKTENIGKGELKTNTWTWSTSDNHVALVDSKTGEITCVGGGEATITAQCGLVKVSCAVTSGEAEHKIHTYGDNNKCTICGDRKPNDVRIQFSLVNKSGAYVTAKDGKTKLFQAPVTVSDLDCDGTITYRDLLEAAHSAYCSTGAKGFTIEEGENGLTVTQFWGTKTGDVGFCANNSQVKNLLGKVSGNCKLVAYFNRDTVNRSDLYTYFAKESMKAVSGMDKTFTVLGMDGIIPAGVTVTVKNSKGQAMKALATTVAEDGSFIVNFPAAGDYVITVSGTASYERDGELLTGAPVLASSVEVEVYAPVSAVLYMTIVDDENNFVKTIDGEEVYRYPFLAVDDPENPDGKVTVYEALKQIHAQKCPAGASGFQDDNGFIRYVWGVNTGGWLSYYFDDVWMQGYSATMTGTYGREFVDRLMGTEINDGVDDYTLYMFQIYGDTYTYFYPRDQFAFTGVAKEFTANGDKARRPQIPAGASITVTDSQGNVLPELATTVDAEGHFSIVFPAAGVYTIDLGNAEKQAYTHSRCFVAVQDVVSTTVTSIQASQQELLSGKTAQLKAMNQDGEAVKDVTWTLANGDERFAALTVKNGVATVKALDVTEKNTITLTANEGKYDALSTTLTILPKAQQVKILLGEEDMTGNTLFMDLGVSADYQPIFTALVEPDGAGQDVEWKSSNTKLATVENGKVTLTGVPGTVKITATTTDGTKRSASVSIQMANLAQRVTIVGADTLLGGKSIAFTANDDAGKAIAKKDLSFYLCAGAEDLTPVTSSYATLTTAGRLTTKAVAETQEVYVAAVVNMNGVYAVQKVTIVPATTTVNLVLNGTVVNGKTLTRNVSLEEEKTLSFSVNTYPEDATQQMSWKSSNTKVATVENGTVTYAGTPGTVNITATTTDGTGKKATVKLTFKQQSTQVTIAEHPGVLVSGSKLILTAATDVAKVGVTWSLADSADKSCVTLNANGTLTAKTVYAEHSVTLIAKAKDGGAVATTTVTIQPKAGLLTLNHQGVDVTKSTVKMDLSQGSTTLVAQRTGSGEETVTWKSSNVKVASVADGVVTAHKAGTVTITATAADGAKATVTVTVTTLVTTVEITGADVLASGKSATYKAVVAPAKASKNVTWSLADSTYATVTTAGRLTAAKNLLTEQTVTLIATAKDGSGITATKTVKLMPAAQSVVIGQSAQTVDMRQNSTMVLTAKVYPSTASQSVTWKSSNAKVASVENGTVTFHKAGTVTFTATTTDGTAKNASVKFTVVKSVGSMTLANTQVAGGKSLNLSKLVGFNPTDATNKKLYWSITGDTAYASLSTSGVLTTKKVTGVKTVTVTAWALDGYGASVSCQVKIYPAATKVILRQGTADVTGKTITATVGQSLTITAKLNPTDAYQGVTWKSSNEKAVTVNKDGRITVLSAGKTVTLTATASDGSGKKATVKIKTVAAK